MASQALPLEEAVQILLDAGCTREFTQQFITALEAEPIQVQLRLLRVQRQCQLDQVHMEEKVGLFGLPAVCAGKAASC